RSAWFGRYGGRFNMCGTVEGPFCDDRGLGGAMRGQQERDRDPEGTWLFESPPRFQPSHALLSFPQYPLRDNGMGIPDFPLIKRVLRGLPLPNPGLSGIKMSQFKVLPKSGPFPACFFFPIFWP